MPSRKPVKKKPRVIRFREGAKVREFKTITAREKFLERYLNTYLRIKAEEERKLSRILARNARGDVRRGDITAIRRIKKNLRELDKKLRQRYEPRVKKAAEEPKYDQKYPSFLTDRFFKENFLLKGSKHKRGSLAMVDIDFLKRVNDRYSHSTGDLVIKMFADTLKSVLERHGGFIGRHGGEEMVLYAPVPAEKTAEIIVEADAKMKANFPEMLQEEIREGRIRPKKNLREIATMSAGIVPVEGGRIKSRGLRYYGEMMQKADELVYKSKRRRNRLTVLGKKPEIIRKETNFPKYVLPRTRRILMRSLRRGLQRMR